jgi:histidyl-tRNA synthetase
MRTTFKKYGFAPLETPAIEYLDVLTGKYGDEADRLIYRLDYKNGTKDAAALHYDLTVPFSRVVAMNPDLPLPFKRYQMQPVWRADRPQPHQGRFREFYQCDVDCVGTSSVLVDAEMIAITYEILSELGFRSFVIKLNNRKILNGLVQHIGLDASFTSDVCRSIDKLDKVEWREVEAELKEKKIPASGIHALHELLGTKAALLQADAALLGGNVLEGWKRMLDNDMAREGIEELGQVIEFLETTGVPANFYRFDISLARGLDYYTGPIFETKLPDHPHIGSLTGGGRYDTLIGMFTGKDMPAVGTTLGLDRIYTAMQQLNLLEELKTSTEVLVGHFGEQTLHASLKLAAELRSHHINTEFYPEQAKLKKQFAYCDKKNIPYMCIIGESELQENKIALKNMRTGEQKNLSLVELIAVVKNRS